MPTHKQNQYIYIKITVNALRKKEESLVANV